MRRLVALFFGGCALFGEEVPWLTGPLIAPEGVIIPLGHVNVEFYTYGTVNTGVYNSHWTAKPREHNFFSLVPQVFCFVGLAPFLDINVVANVVYNRSNGHSATHFGDLFVALDAQLLFPDPATYFPGIKVTVGETFPTGRFDRLDPNRNLVDQSGKGAYATLFGLVFYKVYSIAARFLSVTGSLSYTIAAPVNLHGFSVYGGEWDTCGRIHPGDVLQAILSFEWTLTRNLALALDNVYTHGNKTPFRGRAGSASLSAPSSEQISFAPALEYNFSESFGIIGGCWFSAWGRNAIRFRSGVINIEYTY